jgi:pSer/pThr/pTyr-binding forkhead associated (FHA) protein
MVQLSILSGPTADGVQAVRRFPFRIGRASGNDLSLNAAGVWDHHLVLNLERGEGFTLQTVEPAFMAVNDQRQSSARLHNGDIISFGSAKLQFWLADPVQHGLRAHEILFWTLLVALTLGQLGLIYLLFGLG